MNLNKIDALKPSLSLWESISNKMDSVARQADEELRKAGGDSSDIPSPATEGTSLLLLSAGMGVENSMAEAIGTAARGFILSRFSPSVISACAVTTRHREERRDEKSVVEEIVKRASETPIVCFVLVPSFQGPTAVRRATSALSLALDQRQALKQAEAALTSQLEREEGIATSSIRNEQQINAENVRCAVDARVRFECRLVSEGTDPKERCKAYCGAFAGEARQQGVVLSATATTSTSAAADATSAAPLSSNVHQGRPLITVRVVFVSPRTFSTDVLHKRIALESSVPFVGVMVRVVDAFYSPEDDERFRVGREDSGGAMRLGLAAYRAGVISTGRVATAIPSLGFSFELCADAQYRQRHVFASMASSGGNTSSTSSDEQRSNLSSELTCSSGCFYPRMRFVMDSAPIAATLLASNPRTLSPFYVLDRLRIFAEDKSNGLHMFPRFRTDVIEYFEKEEARFKQLTTRPTPSSSRSSAASTTTSNTTPLSLVYNVVTPPISLASLSPTASRIASLLFTILEDLVKDLREEVGAMERRLAAEAHKQLVQRMLSPSSSSRGDPALSGSVFDGSKKGSGRWRKDHDRFDVDADDTEGAYNSGTAHLADAPAWDFRKGRREAENGKASRDIQKRLGVSTGGGGGGGGNDSFEVNRRTPNYEVPSITVSVKGIALGRISAMDLIAIPGLEVAATVPDEVSSAVAADVRVAGTKSQRVAVEVDLNKAENAEEVDDDDIVIAEPKGKQAAAVAKPCAEGVKQVKPATSSTTKATAATAQNSATLLLELRNIADKFTVAAVDHNPYFSLLNVVNEFNESRFAPSTTASTNSTSTSNGNINVRASDHSNTSFLTNRPTLPMVISAILRSILDVRDFFDFLVSNPDMPASIFLCMLERKLLIYRRLEYAFAMYQQLGAMTATVKRTDNPTIAVHPSILGCNGTQIWTMSNYYPEVCALARQRVYSMIETNSDLLPPSQPMAVPSRQNGAPEGLNDDRPTSANANESHQATAASTNSITIVPNLTEEVGPRLQWLKVQVDAWARSLAEQHFATTRRKHQNSASQTPARERNTTSAVVAAPDSSDGPLPSLLLLVMRRPSIRAISDLLCHGVETIARRHFCTFLADYKHLYAQHQLSEALQSEQRQMTVQRIREEQQINQQRNPYGVAGASFLAGRNSFEQKKSAPSRSRYNSAAASNPSPVLWGAPTSALELSSEKRGEMGSGSIAAPPVAASTAPKRSYAPGFAPSEKQSAPSTAPSSGQSSAVLFYLSMMEPNAPTNTAAVNGTSTNSSPAHKTHTSAPAAVHCVGSGDDDSTGDEADGVDDITSAVRIGGQHGSYVPSTSVADGKRPSVAPPLRTNATAAAARSEAFLGGPIDMNILAQPCFDDEDGADRGDGIAKHRGNDDATASSSSDSDDDRKTSKKSAKAKPSAKKASKKGQMEQSSEDAAANNDVTAAGNNESVLKIYGLTQDRIADLTESLASLSQSVGCTPSAANATTQIQRSVSRSATQSKTSSGVTVMGSQLTVVWEIAAALSKEEDAHSPTTRRSTVAADNDNNNVSGSGVKRTYIAGSGPAKTNVAAAPSGRNVVRVSAATRAKQSHACLLALHDVSMLAARAANFGNRNNRTVMNRNVSSGVLQSLSAAHKDDEEQRPKREQEASDLLAFMMGGGACEPSSNHENAAKSAILEAPADAAKAMSANDPSVDARVSILENALFTNSQDQSGANQATADSLSSDDDDDDVVDVTQTKTKAVFSIDDDSATHDATKPSRTRRPADAFSIRYSLQGAAHDQVTLLVTLVTRSSNDREFNRIPIGLVVIGLNANFTCSTLLNALSAHRIVECKTEASGNAPSIDAHTRTSLQDRVRIDTVGLFEPEPSLLKTMDCVGVELRRRALLMASVPTIVTCGGGDEKGSNAPPRNSSDHQNNNVSTIPPMQLTLHAKKPITVQLFKWRGQTVINTHITLPPRSLEVGGRATTVVTKEASVSSAPPPVVLHLDPFDLSVGMATEQILLQRLIIAKNTTLAAHTMRVSTASRQALLKSLRSGDKLQRFTANAVDGLFSSADGSGALSGSGYGTSTVRNTAAANTTDAASDNNNKQTPTARRETLLGRIKAVVAAASSDAGGDTATQNTDSRGALTINEAWDIAHRNGSTEGRGDVSAKGNSSSSFDNLFQALSVYLKANARTHVDQLSSRFNLVGGGGGSTNLVIVMDEREFRSNLPYELHRQGITLIPMTLPRGDFIISPRCAVERKSFPDLVQSIRSGSSNRLNSQLTKLREHFQHTIVLIEDSDFTASDSSSDVARLAPFRFNHSPTVSDSGVVFSSAMSTIYKNLMRLVMGHREVIWMWGRSPAHSAAMLADMKRSANQHESDSQTMNNVMRDGKASSSSFPTPLSRRIAMGNPDPDLCAPSGGRDGGEKDAQKVAMAVLARFPGVTAKNILPLMIRCRSLAGLAVMSLEELTETMTILPAAAAADERHHPSSVLAKVEGQGNAQMLHAFLHNRRN